MEPVPNVPTSTYDDIPLPPEAQPVGRWTSPHRRVITVMVSNLVAQALLIAYVAHGMKAIHGAHVAHDAAHLRTIFVIGSVVALLIGVGLAVASMRETKRQLRPMGVV